MVEAMSVKDGFTELINIMFIGDSSVGKTSIIKRYTEGFYLPYSDTTIGIDFKTVPYEIKQSRYRLHIWDTAGLEKYNAIAFDFYKKADGFIIVYDVTRSISYQNIKVWMHRIDTHADEHVPKVVVGNKCDVPNVSREVTLQIAQAFGKQYDVPVMEASAATGHNVDKIFHTLVDQILCVRRKYRGPYENSSIQLANGLWVQKPGVYSHERHEHERPLCC